MKNPRCLSIRGEQSILQRWILFGFGFFGTNTALATEYYVATTGSDSNPGTLASPFATLPKGVSAASAGDTVFIRGGTYSPSGEYTFSKSGTSDTNRIKYWAYPGEKPVFDFSKVTNTGIAFNVTGSWLHFKGIEVCNPGYSTAITAIWIADAHNDIMELMNLHHNQGNGIFISHGSGGHLLLNCDSHDNYDPDSAQGDGQNADGFGVHYQAAGDGTSTVIRGCRAWWNSDDGYDFINQEVPVTIENSWAFGAGYANYGTTKPAAGNGNGFKIGSSKTGIRHLVQNNVAWGNKAAGFYANHSSGGNTWYNNTSFQNGTQFNMLASTWSEPNGGGTRTDGVTLTGALAHIMRNNLAFPIKNEYITGYGVDSQFNNWDLNITAVAADFLSITDSTIGGTGQSIEATSLALGPRQADGSLPNVDFMKLAAGSHMIDKGTNVGLPFVGAAPDLGAYEFGATTSAGGAGTGGAVSTTGGKAGTGGSPSTGGVGANTGGRMNTTGGAASNTGGMAVATGGVNNSTGGAAGPTGGRMNTGGAVNSTGGGAVIATGGIGNTGGAPLLSTGGAANTGGLGALGGALSTGGIASDAGSSGTDVTVSGGAGSSTDTGSCSCRVAGLPSRSSTLASVSLLGLLMLRARRRRTVR